LKQLKEIIHYVVKEEKHEVMLLKVLIMTGLLVSIFLPPTHALVVNTATNLIWLFKL
jgi:hypothetical protein